MARSAHPERSRLIAALCFTSSALGLSAVGCVGAADSGRLGTLEVPVDLSAEARAELKAELLTEIQTEVDAEVQAMAAAFAIQPDQSRRSAEVSAGDQSQVRFDQSTDDRWIARLLAAGQVVCLLLALAALLWGYRFGRTRRKRAEAWARFARQRSTIHPKTSNTPHKSRN